MPPALFDVQRPSVEFSVPNAEFFSAFHQFLPHVQHLGPEYVQNIFSHSLKKAYPQKKLRQTKCLLFNFWMNNWPFLPNGFLWYEFKFY